MTFCHFLLQDFGCKYLLKQFICVIIFSKEHGNEHELFFTSKYSKISKSLTQISQITQIILND